MKIHHQTIEADHIAANNRDMATLLDTAVVMSDWRGVNLTKAFLECTFMIVNVRFEDEYQVKNQGSNRFQPLSCFLQFVYPNGE